MSADYIVHYINVDGGAMLARVGHSQIPRVGDEVRLRHDKYFTVTQVVWVEDEDKRRVNIGLKAVDLNPQPR